MVAMASELAARLANAWDEYAPKRGFGWDLLPDDWRDVLGPQGWNDAKDAVRYYGGPHLGGAVSDLMDGGMWAAENMTPAADVRDMMEGSGQITQGVLSNDFWRAAEGAGLLGGATIAMAIPGSVSGARKGVNAVADALPMDEASRMARAHEMFPIEGYHGTRADIDGFENGDIGFHFGTTEQANERLKQTRRIQGAEGENIMPVRLNIRNPLSMPDVGQWNDPRTVARALSDKGFNTDEIIDYAEEIAPQFEDVDEWIASTEAADLLYDLKNIVTDAGYDGIKYRNEAEALGLMTRESEAAKRALYREINSIKDQFPGKPPPPSFDDLAVDPGAVEKWMALPESPLPAWATTRVSELQDQISNLERHDEHSWIAFDPEQVRSRFAKFDPAKRDSGDLLAGLAMPVAAGSALALALQNYRPEGERQQ